MHINKSDCVRGNALNSLKLKLLKHILFKIALTKLHIKTKKDELNGDLYFIIEIKRSCVTN